ncbi:MAG TPA: tetratricopeptide repeat protein, partial [Gammaproteobacteria bacterium]|nr:tetratricopeptide repeat protein [Gammaproteobacteria bacterium]
MDTELRRGFWLADRHVAPSQGEIAGSDGRQRVHPKAMDVLLCLAGAPGEIVARERIIEQVWNAAPASDVALTRCISELRHLLGDDPHRPSFIETVPGRGYRLVAPVSRQAATPGAQPAPWARGGGSGFIAELRRRKVFRVAAVYAVIAWLLIQIAETTFEPLGIPLWGQTLVIALLLLGFPIAVGMAWALELTPQGLVLDSTRSGTLASAHDRRARYLLLGSLALALGVFGYHLLTSTDRPATGSPPSGRVSEPPPVSANSIAVMPFVSIGKAVDDVYFADGLAEEMLGLLGELDELQVAARASSFYFRNKDADLAEISRRLGVRHMLEGSVRRVGDDVRVRAELVDATTGFGIWSETYDRKLEDVFALQDEIAEAIVEELQIVLSVKSARRLANRPTKSGEAIELYLRGRGLLRAATDQAALDAALNLFAAALARDPDFAEAHGGICATFLEKYNRSRATDDFRAGESACRQALTIRPLASGVHTDLGHLYRYSGQYAEAEQEFEAALAHDANDVEAAIGLARALAEQGRYEQAEAAFGRAVDLDPVYWGVRQALGGYYFSRGRFKDAIEQYRRVLEQMPDYANGYNNLGGAFYMLGRFDEAAAAFEHALELAPTKAGYSNLGSVQYYRGRFSDAVKMYRRAVTLAPEDHQLWGHLADAYQASPGQEQAALESYRTAIGLAEQSLKINAADAETMSTLAYYYANVGSPERARDLISQALKLAPDSVFVHYDTALVHARAGDVEPALRAVERAVELGYPAALLPVDPGLKLLAKIERFKQL